jgi:hypothetical protein
VARNRAPRHRLRRRVHDLLTTPNTRRAARGREGGPPRLRPDGVIDGIDQCPERRERRWTEGLPAPPRLHRRRSTPSRKDSCSTRLLRDEQRQAEARSSETLDKSPSPQGVPGRKNLVAGQHGTARSTPTTEALARAPTRPRVTSWPKGVPRTQLARRLRREDRSRQQEPEGRAKNRRVGLRASSKNHCRKPRSAKRPLTNRKQRMPRDSRLHLPRNAIEPRGGAIIAPRSARS